MSEQLHFLGTLFSPTAEHLTTVINWSVAMSDHYTMTKLYANKLFHGIQELPLHSSEVCLQYRSNLFSILYKLIF